MNDLQLPEHIHLIGCGGTGSWVVAALFRLAGIHSAIHLYDGDRLEERNLDRQLFSADQIGQNKAQALATLYGVGQPGDYHGEYFHEGSEVAEDSLLICCADNHAARRNVLRKADETGSTAIIGGNEYTDADAYLYQPRLMRGGPNDPRVFAPEILTDNTGDPRQPAGCTGLAAAASPQLVLANMASADFILRLLWFWYATRWALPNDTMNHWPVLHRSSAYRQWTVLFGDRNPQPTTTHA